MPRALSLKVIRRRIQELEAQAAKLEQAEKPGIKQLRTVLRKFKLGLPDVHIALDGRAGGAHKLRGRKVKPKYRNPGNRSETWTGRGRMPHWMAGMVKKGKKPEDFLIKA